MTVFYFFDGQDCLDQFMHALINSFLYLVKYMSSTPDLGNSQELFSCDLTPRIKLQSIVENKPTNQLD